MNSERCEDPLEFLRILHQPNDVFEIRVPICPEKPGGSLRWAKTAAGYFQVDQASISQAIDWLDLRKPAGIYTTLNVLRRDLLGRSVNKITYDLQSTTADENIVARRWLWIDIDPDKPAGMSATDSEMEACLALGRRMREALTADGWPSPLFGMSGNGCYLFYRVDMPNDDPTKELFKGVLRGLARRFQDPLAEVDTTGFNAARIVKILGTTARKGDHLSGVEGIPDRPHRKSWFQRPTGDLQVVTEEQLRAAYVAEEKTPFKNVQPPLGRGAGGKPAFDNCVKYLAKYPAAIEGQKGSDKALGAACYIFKFGLDGDEARSAFDYYNQKCDPPWSDHEIAHKLRDAREKVLADGTFGTMGQPRERPPRPPRKVAVAPFSVPEFDDEGNVAADEVSATTPKLPEVILPGLEQTIIDSGDKLGRLLDATGKFYIRGGVPVRNVVDADEIKLEAWKPAAACSDFERVAKLFTWKDSEQYGPQLKPATCSESTAKQIIMAESFRSQLPAIRVLSPSPVLLERNGRLEVITNYDRDSGIWAQGEPPPQMSIDKAREVLSGLIAEFNFETPSDRSRALAAVITPALVFGGLLGGRAPVDLGEADSSQAGKGYRNKLTAAIYRHGIKTVTQRERGVGSLQESFDAKLVAGANFISLDNLRGKLESMGIESFLTEPTYSARIPYSAPMEIETERVIVMVTTNRADLSIDLANRSSIVRIQKSPPGTVFRRYPEGDLLDHVVANQPRFLGAVFAIVQEWFRQGKPALTVGDHDFRAWAGKLGWIVQHLLDAAPLLDGHREVQERVATPGANWLRDVALAVKAAAKVGGWLRVGELLSIVLETGIETAGIDQDADLEDENTFKKANQALGRRIGKLVKEGDPTIVGSLQVERRTTLDEQKRTKNEYRFSLKPNHEAAPAVHQHPETEGAAPYSTPYENACSPIPPIANQSLYAHAHARMCGESSAALGGIGETKSHRGEPVPCNHLDPAAWISRDGKMHCAGCDQYMGRAPRSTASDFDDPAIPFSALSAVASEAP